VSEDQVTDQETVEGEVGKEQIDTEGLDDRTCPRTDSCLRGATLWAPSSTGSRPSSGRELQGRRGAARLSTMSRHAVRRCRSSTGTPGRHRELGGCGPEPARGSGRTAGRPRLGGAVQRL